jgi:hypothetical protein
MVDEAGAIERRPLLKSGRPLNGAWGQVLRLPPFGLNDETGPRSRFLAGLLRDWFAPVVAPPSNRCGPIY